MQENYFIRSQETAGVYIYTGKVFYVASELFVFIETADEGNRFCHVCGNVVKWDIFEIFLEARKHKNV